MVSPQILIVGANGYVGGRLTTYLENRGCSVRCLIRSKSSIPLTYPSSTEYVIGDLHDKKLILKALEGIKVVYYLVQASIFAEQFAKACNETGVKKIIFLGVLGSREEAADLLRAHCRKAQVLEFRSSVILGSGSLSFEMIRQAVDRLPVLLIPKWGKAQIQPIHIEDVLLYLYRGMNCRLEGNSIFEIGGKLRTTYIELMKEYAKIRSLSRWIFPVPFFSMLIFIFFTSLNVRASKKLIKTALGEPIVHDPLAQHLFKVTPISYKEALAIAIDQPVPETRWNDSRSSGTGIKDWSSINFGGRLSSSRQITLPITLEKAFFPIQRMGGTTGYYFANWIWRWRGAIDFLLGGVGFRRGRRDPNHLRPGDVIDFWRVADYEPNRYLKLLAEMKTPGRAYLEFIITPHEEGIEYTQRVIFDPIGVLGILYWYLFYPVHQIVFHGMFRKIKKKMMFQ